MVSIVYVQVERGQERNELAQLQSGHMLSGLVLHDPGTIDKPYSMALNDTS